MNTTLSGQYKFEVRRADGSVYETDWFDNLILDNGLEYLGAGSDEYAASYAHVGTGSSVPAVSQISLDARLAGASSNHGAINYTNSGAPAYTQTMTFTYAFSQGAVVGNITEVGVGWTANGVGTLFSRTLIQDSNGNPVALSLTAFDQLTVYYALTFAPPATSTGSLVIDGTTYNYTVDMIAANSFGISYPGSLCGNYFMIPYSNNATCYCAGSTKGDVGGYPSPVSAAVQTTSGCSSGANAYVAGAHSRTYVISFGPSQGNVTGGIQGFTFMLGYPWNWAVMEVWFDRPIPKDETKTFTLNFTGTWGRGA